MAITLKITIEPTCSGLHTVVIIHVKKTIIVCACLGNHREDIGCAHNITIIISKKKKEKQTSTLVCVWVNSYHL